MKKLVILGIVVFIVLISGCTGFELPGISNGDFGQQPVKIEFPPDLIIIQGSTVLPAPPIMADTGVNTEDDFSFLFEVVNQDNLNEVEGVTVSLIDSGLCEGPIVSGLVSTEEGIKSFSSLVPQQTEFIEWRFDSPSNEQIGNLDATCPIIYKVEYEHTTKTQTSLSVMSDSKMRQLQRAGETYSFTPEQIISRGPVKISFGFGTTMPIKTDITVPVFVEIEDKGSGLINYDVTGDDNPVDIKEKELVIGVPTQFTISSSCSKFIQMTDQNITDKGITNDANYNYYWNNNSIAMVRKSSSQIRCSFTAPSETEVPEEKTFFITAYLNYPYKIQSKTNVAIKPTLTQ